MARVSPILVLVASLVALVAVVVAEKNPYCEVANCGKSHVLCQFRPGVYARSCGEVKRVGLTRAEITQIVNYHNDRRDRVASGRELRGSPGPQPRAKSMPHLRWSPTLAFMGQVWANQCPDTHPCTNLLNNTWVSQNICEGSIAASQPMSIESLLEAWYDEQVSNFDRNEVSAYKYGPRPKSTKHYTNVVWGRTTEVGCGYLESIHDGLYYNYLVCNYAPGGNVDGEPIYEVAEPRENCR